MLRPFITKETRSLGAQLKKDLLTVKIFSSNEVYRSRNQILRIFNRYGAVIVEFAKEESYKEQLLCFKKVFGDSVQHDRSDKDMIAEISVIEGYEDYLGTSNVEHFFHTDGAYLDNPPGIVALRCETPASTGGLTRLVSGERLYLHVLGTSKEITRSLFLEDALCVTRAGKKACQPYFKESERLIKVRYRSDDTSAPSSAPHVREGVKIMRRYLEDEKNSMSFVLQHGQVLITDNSRTLHARTSFARNEPRKMHRLFLNGMPSTGAILLGFKADLPDLN